MKKENELYDTVKEIVYDVIRRIIAEENLSAENSEMLTSFSQKKRESVIEEKVDNLMHDIGTPPYIKGYEYIKEAVIMLVKQPHAKISVELYPDLAKKFNTTPGCLERSIRHAKEVTWARGNIELMKEIFGNTVDTSKKKTTNKQFLVTLAKRIRLDSK